MAIEDPIKIATYTLAGLSMMLNIRLVYSASPFALLRFKFPENLFSVFVRVMAGSLELWCLPSMLLGNIIELCDKYAIDNGYPQRQYKDAYKYDVNGDGLMDKLHELIIYAHSLHNEANALSTAVSELNEQAGKLKDAASKTPNEGLKQKADELAKTPSDDDKAGEVITQFETVREAYNKLMTQATNHKTNPAVKAVETAYKDLKGVYDTMLNVTKAKKLQKQANGMSGDATQLHGHATSLASQIQGDSAESNEALKQKAGKTATTGTLRGLANELYNEASALASAVGGDSAAKDLKDAVGTEGSGDNLAKSLKDLGEDDGGAPEKLPAKAQAVKQHYVKVKAAYGKVQGQQSKYTGANKDAYGRVEKAWDAFNAVYQADLKGLANALSTAVGASADPQGSLQQALNALKNHSGDNTPREKGELVRKAQEVIEKFNAADKAYNAVKELEDTYKNIANAGSQYGQVTSKLGDLKNKFDAGKCKDISLIHDKEYIRYCSIICTWSNFATFVILLIVFVTGGENGHVTAFYWVIAASGFVFGINMVMVYALEYIYFPWYIAGENSFPVVTSAILYVTTTIFGNRRKWNSDYVIVLIDIVISSIIAFVAAVLWTYCYVKPSTHSYFPPSSINPAIVSPALMVIVGMGLVYSIYPAIAPGMIVPFYLIDKIEMVLLILTTIPPLIFATLRYNYGFGDPKQPMCEWTLKGAWGIMGSGLHWHFFDILMPLQISLMVIFLYSLHYRHSSIARSIINQPKMSTFLSIIFYMCHEIMLALGFPGMIGNNGGDYIMLPIQYIGALLMVLLAFYSVGYITEYKRHDPSQWPTEGMTKWNALCYWLKMASKITNKNFKQLFTKDLRRDLVVLSIQCTRFHKINKIKYISKFFSNYFN